MAKKTAPQPQLTRIYLRASTDKQNASRAKDSLTEFAKEKGLIIAGCYEENESGTILERPELNRLIADSKPNDIVLIEDIDRLSRLTLDNWIILKQRIKAKQLYIVALNIAPTHTVIALSADESTRWFAMTITDLVIEISAENARKAYETLRNRTRQGIDRVLANPTDKAEKYLGRPTDLGKYTDILELLDKGVSWRKVTKLLKCSITTIKKAKDWNEQGRPDLNIKFKERKRKSKSRLTAIDDTPILPPSEPKPEPAPIPSPTTKPTKKAKPTPQGLPLYDGDTTHLDNDWRVNGLNDEQFAKLQYYSGDFGDFNIDLFMKQIEQGKSYLVILNEIKPKLQNPKTAQKYKGIDEILAK